MAQVDTARLPSLRYWRAQRGYTQARLASRIGMRRNTIWWIEAGHPTRMRTAHLLAAALRVPLGALLQSPPSDGE